MIEREDDAPLNRQEVGPCADASPAKFELSHMNRLKTPAWIFDIDQGRVFWANQAGLKVWRARTLDELTQREMAADMSASVRRRLRQYQEDFQRGNSAFSELWTIYPEGAPRTLRVLFTGITLPDGRMAMFCEGLADASEQPDTLRSAEALLHTQLMISLYSSEGISLYRNPAARSALDIGSSDLSSRFVDSEAYESLIAALPQSGEVRRVMRMRTSRGTRWHEVTARECRDAVTGTPAYLISEVDVSDLKETEEKANFLAYHDALTGLPNRSSVSQNFGARLRGAEATGTSLGVFFLDLDCFKFINDSLGHAFGDEVLIEVARRLTTMVDEETFVARLGGDEFLILMSGRDQASYEAKAKRLLDQLSSPFEITGRKLTVTHSIGISLYPDHGRDVASLMKSADLAMYNAKDNGRNCYSFFSETMRDYAESRLELVSSIKAALTQGEFEVYYQPRVSSADLAIVGAEALVRWNHPQRGLVPPGEFIPLCEETGLIEGLGEFVLRAAMRQQRRWHDQGHPISVSINMSPRQLRSPILIETVRQALDDSGCDPAQIEIELTESMLMEHDDGSTPTIELLHQLGVRISVDDFGTGYSNLARLHEFSVDCVKIDRTFIHELSAKKPLTEIIITLCKLMKVKIVAEGVETLEQLSWLRSRDCQELQGFYFSKPVPVALFDRLLAARSDRPSGLACA
jgi:diguanylate cyclase (GGDEF)-like protein